MDVAQKTPVARKGRGGKREGAGCKPSGPRRRVRHVAREEVVDWAPLHITLRLVDGVPGLRQAWLRDLIRDQFAGCEKRDFRVTQYSVLDDHLHLIAEAEHNAALTRGMTGLMTRLARNLNRRLRRRGRLFADRYHLRVLRTHRRVKNALRYCLLNARKHGLRFQGLDEHSSGRWFTGWVDHAPDRTTPSPVARARSWLQEECTRIGIRPSIHEIPGT